MDWKDVAGVVAKAAPLLGTALGGPAGGAVGGLISAALGVASTPDAIHDAVKANPEAAVKLAQVEADNKVHLQQLVVQGEQARLAAETAEMQARFADVSSARTQTVELAKTGSLLAWGAGIISAIVLITFGAVLYALLTKTVPPGQEGLLQLLLGALVTLAVNVVGYWVGSSSGSAHKNSIVAGMATTLAAQKPPIYTPPPAGYVAPPWRDPDKG